MIGSEQIGSIIPIQGNLNQSAQKTSKTKESISFAQSYQEKLRVSESLDSIFEEAAQIYGVDVNLLKAIGKAESNFQADAKSSAGAMGIMQIMPATANEYGVTNPYDPRQNIMAGAREISTLLERYDGDLELALAGYNAGIGNVAKYGGVPPFRETQNYIKKVMDYMQTPITTGKTVLEDSSSANLVQNNSLKISTTPYYFGMNALGGVMNLSSIPINYGQTVLNNTTEVGASALAEMDYQKMFYYMLEQMKYNMDVQATTSAFSLEEDSDIGSLLG